MSVRIQVLFYSMYGHIYCMSEAVVEGAREVGGAEVSLYQVAELVPEEALEKIGANPDFSSVCPGSRGAAQPEFMAAKLKKRHTRP